MIHETVPALWCTQKITEIAKVAPGRDLQLSVIWYTLDRVVPQVNVVKHVKHLRFGGKNNGKYRTNNVGREVGVERDSLMILISDALRAPWLLGSWARVYGLYKVPYRTVHVRYGSMVPVPYRTVPVLHTLYGHSVKEFLEGRVPREC